MKKQIEDCLRDTHHSLAPMRQIILALPQDSSLIVFRELRLTQPSRGLVRSHMTIIVTHLVGVDLFNDVYESFTPLQIIYLKSKHLRYRYLFAA